MLPGQRRQRHDPSRSFPVDLRCQHGSTRFTQVGLPFPVLQGSPRWFLTCQTTGKTPGSSRSMTIRHHPGPSRWHSVQPPVLPGSPRSMDRGEPGSTGSPVGLGHYMLIIFVVSAVKVYISMAAFTLPPSLNPLPHALHLNRSVDWESRNATLI